MPTFETKENQVDNIYLINPNAACLDDNFDGIDHSPFRGKYFERGLNRFGLFEANK